MALRDVIDARRDTLSEADRRLVAVLLEDSRAGSYLAAHEVAQRAGVHQSTAGRLARKLGFHSYRDMREALRTAVMSELDAAQRVRRRLDRVAGHSVLESVVDGEIQALSAIPQQISQSQIDAATTILCKARRILVAGESHASSLAELFARRLVRSGYDAVALGHTDWLAADALLDLAAGDAVFGMVFRHDSAGIETMFRHAGAVGAWRVLLTEPQRSVVPDVDLSLVARRGETGETHSMTVPMAICNTLILELSLNDDGRSLERLGRLEGLRRRFYERDGAPPHLHAMMPSPEQPAPGEDGGPTCTEPPS
jgi:DNA-binding MurR/RpiR family transcriptional regulator